jgi:hypothetical protein
MPIDSHLYTELGDTTAKEAVELLCNEFNLGRSWITFELNQNRVELKTFLGVTTMAGIRASDVGPIKFWGGPPQGRGLTSGTLLTYLFDAILYNHVLFGHYSEFIGTTNVNRLRATQCSNG